MSISEELHNFVISNIEGVDSVENIGISMEIPEESGWDTDNDKDIAVITSRFVDAPESWDVETRNKKAFLYPEEDSFLYNEILNKFDWVRRCMTINKDSVNIGGITISENRITYDDEDNVVPQQDWDDWLSDSYYAMYSVTNQNDVTDIGQKIMSDGIDTLDDWFSTSESKVNIDQMRLSFSDMHYCQLQTVSITIMTETPHMYYSDVESVSEYISEIAQDEDELEDLRKQERYEVFIRLDFDEDQNMDPSNIPDEIKNMSEKAMRRRMDEYITINGDYTQEGEVIEISPEDETTKFWVRQQFDW